MHQDRQNCPGRVSRREFVSGAALGTLAGVGGMAAAWAGYELLASRPPHILSGKQSSIIAPAKHSTSSPLGIPGPWPGKVVEVNHPGSVHNAVRNQPVVGQMLARGMRGLVGSDDDTQAWRYFFQPGDRVGIKVVPVGQPLSISSFELVREIIDALHDKAGVRRRDILVFERYKDAFVDVGYPKHLPDGVHWECSSAFYDEAQTEIDGQVPGQPRQSRTAGYDPDVYREEPYCQIDPNIHKPTDDRRYRSHVSKIITRKIDKFISIPVLKDHRSAGVTLCLKNLSHGSVNNVARSHVISPDLSFGDRGREAGAGSLNQCNQFIPAMVSLPAIRQKAVLQILDGLVGTYEGGPGNWNPTFATWEYKSLFFATDPVALDRVGWEIIDQKRLEMGLSPVSMMGTLSDENIIERDGQRQITETFHHRQPQHIPLAATLGLGEFARSRIKHHRIPMGGAKG